MPLTEYIVAIEKAPSAPQTPQRQDRPGASTERLPAEVVRRIGKKDISRLTRQLATLLHAGMPLSPALSALVESASGGYDARPAMGPEANGGHPRRRVIRWGLQNDPLVQVIARIRDDVNEGLSLSVAFGKYPDIFSNVFVNMVEAGESSGALEDILRKLAEMLETKVRLAGKIRAVIAYPLMMAVVAVGVVMFLLSFVVPSITQIFLEMNRQLPWPTRLLISICSFMRAYWLLFPAAACGAFFAVAAWLRTEQGRMRWDRSRLTLPLFGRLLLKLEIARMARTLGALLSSGVPILRALDIVKGVVGNRFVAAALNSVKDSIGRGANIAESMRATGLFPPIVLHIIATGQISGGIEDGLIDIADMYDDEVEQTSKALVSLLEPAILLVMGAVVGFIVLAILLPIFDINQAL
jgi:general secretion pathway protein F